MAGRKAKGTPDETFDPQHGTKRTTMRFAPELLTAAAAVREPGETFTAQVEDGLRRHIKARTIARRRQRPEGE